MRVDSLAIQPVSQPSLPVSSLTELLTQLNSVSIKLRQRPTAPERRTGELAAAEYAVLNIIRRTGALTVPQIARERSTSRQNIQILVDRLKTQGNVQVVDNPAHKRSGLVSLTEQGMASLANDQGQKQLLSDMESHLSDAEIQGTIEVLKKVQELLGNNENRQANVPVEFKPESSVSERTLPPGSTELDPSSEDFPLNLL